MKPLEIPTDNLYKFMALAGIAIVLSCAYLATSLQRDLNRQAYDHFVRYKVWGFDLEKLQADTTSLSVALSDIEKAMQAQADALRGPGRATSALDDIRSETKELRRQAELSAQRYDELRKRLIAEEVEHGELSVRARQTSRQVALLCVGGAIGALLALWGFWLWYSRVQRYLDVQLKTSSS